MTTTLRFYERLKKIMKSCENVRLGSLLFPFSTFRMQQPNQFIDQ